MSTIQHVKIGREFFAKIKNDYADWRRALIREFLQNCFDAPGCTKTEVTISSGGGNTYLSVKNNGAPMSQEVLTTKLLTLGGSGKNFDGENTGGFGVAKSLLYYMHKSYVIQTGSLLVTGSGGSYDLNSASTYIDGTESQVVIEGNEEERLVEACQNFASMAQWKGTLTLNGRVLPTCLKKGTRRKDLGWAVVYSSQAFANTCVVRLNGQPMFSIYTRYKGTILLELTGKANETLTSNRDSLRGSYSSALSDLLTALAVDKRSALKEQRAEYKRFQGEKMRNEAKQPKQVGEQGLAQVLNLAGVAAAVAASGGPKSQVQAVPSTADGGGIKIVVESREDAPATISLGPEFILKNTTGLKTPTYYTPGNSFSNYSREMVRVWAGLLLKLYQMYNISAEFSIGFILDDECLAEYEQGIYGRVYYINPVRLVEEGKRRFEPRYESAWKDRHEVISSAAHEFVHGAFGLGQHDEDFASRMSDVMAKVIKSIGELDCICKPEAAPKEPRVSNRIDLFGRPITSVIRWMGKKGWSFQRASEVLTSLKDKMVPPGSEVAQGTISAQLYAGAKGQRGDPAPLTEEQEEELIALSY